MEKKIKLGFDFDGVIADTIKVKQKLAKKFYNVKIPSHRFKEYMVIEDGLLNHKQYRHLMNNVCGNFEYGHEMEEVETAVNHIKDFIELGCDVCVITSREGSEVEVAKKWCELRGLNIDFISVGYGENKVESARGLDVYIDDDVPKLEPLRGVVSNIFLFSNEHNHGHKEPNGVTRVGNWPEFRKHVENVINQGSSQKKSKFDDEEFIGHKPFAKIWLQDYGINSDVLLYKHYDSDKKSIKIRFGARKGGFELKEAIEMTNDILTYQEKLEKRFVPLPPIEKMNLEYDPQTHKIEIVKTSTWTGADVGKIVKTTDYENDKGNLERLLIDMCKIVKSVCRERVSGWDVEVGIDPRATNFTLDDNHNVWFVDLFPPRYRKKGKPIVEWPKPKSEIGEKIGYFKHYSIPGIILCMTAQLARLKPKMKEYFERIVFKEFREVMSEKEIAVFEKEIAEAPWIMIRKLLQNEEIATSEKVIRIEEILKNSLEKKVFEVDYYIYILREIVLEYANAKLVSEKEVESFFSKSHFEDRLPTELTDVLIGELVQYLKRID